MAYKPLYRKIAEAIYNDIRNGTLPVGSVVPSTRELHEKYFVSHVTALRALNLLTQKQVIVKQTGSNFRVAKRLDMLNRRIKCIGGLFRPFSIRKSDCYYNELMSGAMHETALSGMNIIFSGSVGSSFMAQQNPDFAGIVESATQMAQYVEGFLADSWLPDAVLQEILDNTHLPMVVVDRTTKLSASSVVYDNLQALRAVMPTLLRMGYECFVGVDSGIDYYYGNIQQQFFAEVAAGHPFCAVHDFNRFAYAVTIPQIIAGVKKFGKRRTVIFMPSDTEAVNCIECLREQGLNVPEFAGVISCRNIQSIINTPYKLTTMALKAEELGAEAVRILLNDKMSHGEYTLPMDFRFGETI